MDNPCNRCMSFLECAGENQTCEDYVGFVEELNAKRLAAVRELVMEAVYARDHGVHQPQFNNAIEALAAVWPEAVGEK